MFRASCLVMGLLCAAPASAGTAAAFDFTAKVPEAPRLANSVISNGVAAAGTAEFVVYNHGIWTAPRPAATKSAATPDVTTTAALPTPVEQPVAMEAPTCGDAQIPWRSRLSTRTIAARMAYWPLVRDAECRHQLPSGLLDALVLHESRYMPWAVSRVGAGGLTQLMPGTARDLGVSNRFDPVSNIDAGARYLRAMLDRYRSIPFALAAYNAGPGAVDRAGGIPANVETPGYVLRIPGSWREGNSASMSPPALMHALSLDFSGSSPE
jgi:soluble lytic murein transglycosylase-like protein